MGRMDKKRGGDKGEEKEEKEDKAEKPSKTESLERERSWNIGTRRSIKEFFERKREGKKRKKRMRKGRFIRKITS